MKKIYISFCCMFLFVLTSFNIFGQDDRFYPGSMNEFQLSDPQRLYVCENYTHIINDASFMFIYQDTKELAIGYNYNVNERSFIYFRMAFDGTIINNNIKLYNLPLDSYNHGSLFLDKYNLFGQGKIDRLDLLDASCQVKYNCRVKPNINYGYISYGGSSIYGSTSVIRAVAYEGYLFEKWSNGSKENPIRLINDNFTISLDGNFIERSSVVSLFVEPSNGGIVSGGGVYKYWDNVVISAKAKPGYIFKQWSDGSKDITRTITPKNEFVATAIFEKEPPITPNVPSPNINDNFKPNIDNNVIVQGNISDGLKGSGLNLYRNDIYDVYLVPTTKIVQDGNDYKIVHDYKGSSGNIELTDNFYVVPVYKYTNVSVFAPNFSVSNLGFQYLDTVFGDSPYLKALIATSKGMIQKDVNSFKFDYVDSELSSKYSYSQLPLRQNDTDRSVVYVGEHLSTNFDITSSYTGSYFVHSNVDLEYHFSVTDKQDIYNEIVIQNNIQSNFNNLDNLFQNGNVTSQGANSNLGNVNNKLDSTINDFDNIENQFNNSLQQNASQIKPNDFLFNSQKMLNAMKFVSTNFTNLISDSNGNNPFGIVLGFGLMLGLALLFIGKRTR